MKDRSRHIAYRSTLALAAAITIGLLIASPSRAQETFEHIGIVKAISPLQQWMVLLARNDSGETELTYTVPRAAYEDARDNDDHPVTLQADHLVRVTGHHDGRRLVIDHIRVLRMVESTANEPSL